MNHIEYMREHLKDINDRNPFVRLLDMKIVEVSEGETKISMPVVPDKHTNVYNVVHGGAVSSLADTVMGIACATMGNKVVTIELNINYISNVAANDTVHALGKVIHSGRSTMVAEAEMVDSSNKLIAKSRATFMIIGRFEHQDYKA